ncbi:hypothetical protein Leryth_018149 [Lithospermum erythrorhizon]|nr:hypothetical protein Leryth_018149 [Lithospermum erythrorhizon]
MTELKKRRRQMKDKRDNNTLFALILAALFSPSNSNKSQSKLLIKKCLNLLDVQTLSAPLISLLPTLLNSKCDDVACKTVDIVGKASLTSFEMNEMIASQDDVIVCLVSLLRRSNTSIQVVACSAIMDLSTTYTGRHRLLQFCVLESLIDCFVQAPSLSLSVISLLTKKKNCDSSPKVIFEMGEACVSLLHAAITLINACTIDQLQEILKVLSGRFLVSLKNIWEQVHDKMLYAFSMSYNQDEMFGISNIRVNDLAETIFRLSLYNSQLRGSSQFNKFESRIFYASEISFKQFLLNNWEETPLHIKDPMKAMKQDAIFDYFRRAFRSKDAVISCLPSIMKTFISCPPIASDDLDVLHFIKEAGSHLGCPLIYQQDIRVVKAQSSEKDLHYFGGQPVSCSQGSQYLVIDDILKCAEAYMDGYTIALRGMEFRFKSIAADAEELATLFGQPSAGVNMYLTPPNSQGLSCHSDDHCVFVCQVVGTKQWTIFPPTNVQLPRLYDPAGIRHYSEVNQDGEKFLLREGDVLYIPRGFPHKAQTITAPNRTKETDEFSLHMTLAIEVERPFEWEGFFHVALHHWELKQKVSGKFSSNLYHMVVKLMHIAIKLQADLDPKFRKACLSGAISLPSQPEEWLDIHQKTIFIYLVNRITNESSFESAIEHVLTSFAKSEDPFQEISWLHNFGRDCEVTEDEYLHNSLVDPHEYFAGLNRQQKDDMGVAFAQVKSMFCSEVVYEDAQQKYIVLLQKYRMVRKQYTNGMLSLHSTGDDIHEEGS